jgi:spore germination protein
VGPGPQATAQGPFRTYRVQPGDTLRVIADTFGVSPASIIQASALQNPDRLRPGQILTIPSQPGTLYRVQPGETLDQIAARTGVPPSAILEASHLSSDTLRPGDVILIPDLRPSK